MEHAVRVEGLVKRFGSLTAVDGVTFSVESGEIFGILGPNGAGKTTTLEIIEGLQTATEGSVEVLGLEVRTRSRQVKSRIGVQLQSSSYYDYLTLSETISLLGSFYPRRVSPRTLLEQVGLADRAKSYHRHLSGGQKQRFAVAASLVNSPEVVILDEPTTGLDPQARRNLWDLVRDIRERGVTVLLTTHYMEEAEALCDRIAIMDAGTLLAVDSVENLVHGVKAAYSVKLVLSRPLDASRFASLGVDITQMETGEAATYVLRLKDGAGGLNAVLSEIGDSDLGLEHLEITPVTLEDVYLGLTGAGLRD